MAIIDTKQVIQNNNSVGGHLVAGDLQIINEVKTTLRVMAENYRNEIQNSDLQKEFIEELQDFMKRVPGRDQRDLEQKLTAAKRVDMITDAKLLKEKFAKKLYRHTFSPNAQVIFVHILSVIRTCFQLKVLPLIRESKAISEIDTAIYNCIIEVIYNQVGNSELDINMDHIHGMLYYLTGNCYINWE